MVTAKASTASADYCAGSGVEEIEVEPITLEDLEEQCPAR
jgi:hypothetical protein